MEYAFQNTVACVTSITIYNIKYRPNHIDDDAKYMLSFDN